MTFNLNSLKLIESFGSVGALGQGMYGYATNDTKATIEGANYFGGAAKHLQAGDIIHVSGDLDGTPFHTSYVVASNNGTTVVLTEHAAVTQNVKQIITVRVPVLGTASTQYVASPIAGSITKVLGVSNANNGTGISTITVSVPTTGAIATLPFPSNYTAPAIIEDSTITAHVALAAGGLITVATDGTGDGAGEAIVTLEITPA